jgi:hypothetical protein
VAMICMHGLCVDSDGGYLLGCLVGDIHTNGNRWTGGGDEHRQEGWSSGDECRSSAMSDTVTGTSAVTGAGVDDVEKSFVQFS